MSNIVWSSFCIISEWVSQLNTIGTMYPAFSGLLSHYIRLVGIYTRLQPALKYLVCAVWWTNGTSCFMRRQVRRTIHQRPCLSVLAQML
ncbi:hypothetical protein BDV24DRAFT_145029, partial [Aspergillus arachidicola]